MEKDMIYPTTDQEAIDFFITLLKEKGIEVKFHHPHSGNSACETPAVYAVDQPMSFSREELAPIKDFFCTRDMDGFNSENSEFFTIVHSICFKIWVEFEYLPDAFVAKKWFRKST